MNVLVLLVGALVLLHAMLGAIRWRQFAKTHGRDAEGLPGDVVLETLVGAGVALLGLGWVRASELRVRKLLAADRHKLTMESALSNDLVQLNTALTLGLRK